MVEEGGNGEGGRLQYVTSSQFDTYCRRNDAEHQKFALALWGAEGRNGLIGDVQQIKYMLKLVSFLGGLAVTVITPLITALIMKYFGVVG